MRVVVVDRNKDNVFGKDVELRGVSELAETP
jgi:hypothetical protein